MSDQLQRQYFKLIVALATCALLCLVCYDIFGGLWLKGITSTWFVLLGLVNMRYAKKKQTKDVKFIFWMVLGLLFGMCADVLLGIHFLLGILFFASGHVFYLLAFYALDNFHLKDVLIIVPIACVSIYVVIGTPYICIEDPFLKKLLMGYALIIASMLGKAISNATTIKSTSYYFILLGSILFWFSDLMLAIDMFGEASRFTWVLCSYSYWPAQNMLALSIFHYVNEH